MGHSIGDTRFSLPALLKIGPHSEEGGRVTMFELFFDLVFVFSFTQVSRLMAEGHDAIGGLGFNDLSLGHGRKLTDHLTPGLFNALHDVRLHPIPGHAHWAA